MIARQPFGSTGHLSSRTIFGAAALWSAPQDQADAALALLLQHGVNHIDVAASYGEAELRVGPWMEQHRDRFFLATKTLERTYEGAKAQLEASLERLRVRHVDLWQLHYLVDEGGWQTALGPGGALEAALEARAQGRVRFIGVTGHGLATPRMHLRSLERFPFDSVLLPWNYPLARNAAYAADVRQLVEVCRQRGVAVQAIKSLTAGPWDEKPHTAATWYEPLQEQADIDRAVHWLLGRPDVFLNTAGDLGLLPRVLDAAERFQAPPSDADMETMAERLAMRPLFV